MASETQRQAEPPVEVRLDTEEGMSRTRRTPPGPPAPLVGAALSGFVVGVILTLLLTGVVIQGKNTATPTVSRLPTPSRPSQDRMYAQIKRLVLLRLGPSDINAKASRLISLHLLPVGASAGSRYHEDAYRTVAVIFRLYDHPLGPAWRLRAAKADIFSVMKALYTSGLPVYDVEMLGRFPIASGKHYRVQTVLEAFMSYQAASHIPWKHWARDQEGQLWNMLPYKYIDPRFA